MQDVAAKEKNPFVPNFGTHMTPSRLQYTVVGIQRLKRSSGFMEMKMTKMTEDRVKNILRFRNSKLKIYIKNDFPLRRCNDTDSVLETVALPAQNISGMPGARGEHKDLGNVLINYQNELYRRNAEIREMMWALSQEEQSINRVWACFHVLEEPFMISSGAYMWSENYIKR